MTKFERVKRQIERMKLPASYGGVVSISEVSNRVADYCGWDTKRKLYAFDSTEYTVSGYQSVYTNLDDVLDIAKDDAGLPMSQPELIGDSFRVRLGRT